MTTSDFTMMQPTDLKPHPLQQQYYDEPPEADLRALADDLLHNGQRDPIHVMPPENAAGLPPFTILDGNRRARAAVLAGLPAVKVLIRHDLKDAHAATVETEFLKFNFLRRQLRPLQKARIALRLFLIEKKRPPGTMRSSDAPEARERVGEAIGMSGRNLDRYFNVLRTPPAVQDAVDHGHLPLVLGARVAGLRADQQQALASEIATADPKAIGRIVRERLGVPAKRRHTKPNDALAAFLRQLDHAIDDLDGRLDQTARSGAAEALATLYRAEGLIMELIRRATNPEPSLGHDVLRHA